MLNLFTMKNPLLAELCFLDWTEAIAPFFTYRIYRKNYTFLTFLQWLRNSSVVFFIILMDPDSGACIWIQKFRNRYVENQIIPKIKHVKATIKFWGRTFVGLNNPDAKALYRLGPLKRSQPIFKSFHELMLLESWILN